MIDKIDYIHNNLSIVLIINIYDIIIVATLAIKSMLNYTTS
jgi:hypothetical protein